MDRWADGTVIKDLWMSKVDVMLPRNHEGVNLRGSSEVPNLDC